MVFTIPILLWFSDTSQWMTEAMMRVSRVEGVEFLKELGYYPTDLDYDAAYEKAAADDKLYGLRQTNPWVRDLIRVLWPYEQRGRRRLRVIDDVERLRKASGLPMPSKLEHTVQSTFNHHTSQSTRWNGKPQDDLFFSPQGKGSGSWAVHRDRAAAWLLRHELPEA
jgi:hypothetical protein